MDLAEIGETVRKARVHAGMTQQELADAAGLSRVRVSQLETGTLSGMRFGSVLEILNAVGLDLKVRDHNMGRPTLDELMDNEGPEPW